MYEVNRDMFPDRHRKCKCGGWLIQESRGRYIGEDCKYYEHDGVTVTGCDGGLPNTEFVELQTIKYKNKYYVEADVKPVVGDLVICDKSLTNGKRINKVKDYSGYNTLSVKLVGVDDVIQSGKYKVLKEIGVVK